MGERPWLLRVSPLSIFQNTFPALPQARGRGGGRRGASRQFRFRASYHLVCHGLDALGEGGPRIGPRADKHVAQGQPR